MAELLESSVGLLKGSTMSYAGHLVHEEVSNLQYLCRGAALWHGRADDFGAKTGQVEIFYLPQMERMLLNGFSQPDPASLTHAKQATMLLQARKETSTIKRADDKHFNIEKQTMCEKLCQNPP